MNGDHTIPLPTRLGCDPEPLGTERYERLTHSAPRRRPAHPPKPRRTHRVRGHRQEILR